MVLIPFLKEITVIIVLIVVFDIWRKTHNKRLMWCTLLLFILFGMQTFNISSMLNRYILTGFLLKPEPPVIVKQ